MGRVVELSELKREISKIRKEKKKIVFTNGCFDILHLGHIHLLKKAKKLGDVLIIGLNSDSSVKKIKGEERPIKDENTRAQILASLEMVDFVVIFKEKTPLRLIKSIRPDVLVKGGDWKESEIVGADFVKSYKGKVKRIKYLKGHSTTQIIKRIKGEG